MITSSKQLSDTVHFSDPLLANGGKPSPNRNERPDSIVTYVLGMHNGSYFASLYKHMDIFKGRLPLSTFPIATDPFGNLFIMSLHPNGHGHIYFGITKGNLNIRTDTMSIIAPLLQILSLIFLIIFGNVSNQHFPGRGNIYERCGKPLGDDLVFYELSIFLSKQVHDEVVSGVANGCSPARGIVAESPQQERRGLAADSPARRGAPNRRLPITFFSFSLSFFRGSLSPSGEENDGGHVYAGERYEL